jgi:hypothetical protein
MPRSVPPPATPPVSLVRRLQLMMAGVALLLLAWAALAPLRYPTRELDVDLSQAGRVPATLRLTVGVRDVLLLRNRDAHRAHVFGPVRVAPRHLFRLPFEQTGAFAYACDVVPGEQVIVRVGPYPDPGWGRLTWRLRTLADAVRGMAPQKFED